MTILIEEQTHVYNFSVVWGFSWGWGWNMNYLQVGFFFVKKIGIFYSNTLLPVEKICNCRKYVREIACFLFRFPSAVQHCERCTRVLFIIYELGQFLSLYSSQFEGFPSVVIVLLYCIVLLLFLFLMGCCLCFCFLWGNL